MERMRPDDHFMVVMETAATPMHIGALLILEVDAASKPTFAQQIRAHFLRRLKYTPLLRVLKQSPEGYDADAWFSVSESAAEAQIRLHASPSPLDDAAIEAFIAKESMGVIDLAGPPFEIHIIENVTENRAAIYIKVHHCVTDGVGFQHLIGMLSDNAPTRLLVAMSGYDEALPHPEDWRQSAESAFEAEADLREQAKSRKIKAIEDLAKFEEAAEHAKTQTPEFEFSGPTSSVRSYRTLSVPLKDIKDSARALGAKINDVFHWIASTCIRTYLAERGLLPESSLSVNSARSYRTPEHGHYGNRIVALRPRLSTDIADPMERLRDIQSSLRVEIARSEIEVQLLNQPEKPFGAARRREHFAKQAEGKKIVLTGNVTLSNVPGPADRRNFASFRQIANYPVPLLGNGRFLNITSRRNENNLDWGIMVDPEKVTDVDGLVDCLERAISELQQLAELRVSV